MHRKAPPRARSHTRWMAVKTVAFSCAEDNGIGKPAHFPAKIAPSSSARLQVLTSAGVRSPDGKVHETLTSVTSLRMPLDCAACMAPELTSCDGARKSVTASSLKDSAATAAMSRALGLTTGTSGSAVRTSRKPTRKPGLKPRLGHSTPGIAAERPISLSLSSALKPHPSPRLLLRRPPCLRLSTMKRSTSTGEPTLGCKLKGSSTACVGAPLASSCVTVDRKRCWSSAERCC
mmetsp:Transcript_104435/g.261813  ORF Transcript_104435/g.261813 Transcript_104435/m.261813 type:complete len:233 (+) Transcript_104435:560-1258(+)